MRQVDFAKAHQLKVHDLKHCYAEGKIALTIYHRQGEIERNQQEWWITPSDVHGLLTYWQQQAWPYGTCALCPHQEDQVS